MKGWVDIHCHALPAVDDGADSIDTALQMLRAAVAEGVSQVILTPHFRAHDQPERLRLFERTFTELSDAAEAANLPVILHLGAEIAFRFGMDAIATDPSARLAGSPYVLVDLPPGPLSPGLEQAFFDLRTRGWRPILAHPERHRDLAQRPEQIQRLRDQDLLLQVDAGSLNGRFGDRAKAAATWLVEQGWVDFVASDGHGLSKRRLSVRRAAARLHELVGAARTRRLIVENPARVLTGESLEPDAVPSPVTRRGGIGRWIQERFTSPAIGRG